jgi:hypothetical protein
MGLKRNAYRTLVEKPEGKRALGTPRHMWVDNIRMDLRGRRDCIHLDQWRALVNTVIKLWVPQNFGKILNSSTTGSYSRRDQIHEVSVACSNRYSVMTL